MIADFYKCLAERLATSVPRLQRVTLFNEQLTSPGSHYELALPMALIEFQSIAWEAPTRGVQRGEATVAVTVVASHIGDFIHGSPSQDQALSSLRLQEEVHLALAGFGGPAFGPMVRTSTEVDHRHDSVIAHTLIYRCPVTDDSTDLLAGRILAHPGINVTGDVDHSYPPNAAID